MKFVIRAAALAAFALGLAGCYQTSAPLITAANADYPLGETVRYSLRSEAEAAEQFFSGIRRIFGQIRRDGDRYSMRGDADEDGNEQSIFFYHAQNDLYVVQRGHLHEEAFHYDLVRIQGDTVARFSFECDGFVAADAEAIGSGAFQTHQASGAGLVCTPGNIETLAQVLVAKSANATPEIIYTLNPNEAPGAGLAQNAQSNATPQNVSSTPIAAGQSISGQLATGDPMRDGKYYEAYRFSGTAGQSVTIDMNADNRAAGTLDTYLMLFRAGDMTNEIASDDDGGNGLNAQITHTLPANGDYVVFATSAYRDSSGTYEITLSGEGLVATGGALSGVIEFGEDSSRWANNGECDDPRFEGAGMASYLISSDIRADATDCRNGVRSGQLRLVPPEPGGVLFEGIDFGDDNSSWANNGECDDPRFEGSAMASYLIASDMHADATDCSNAYREGNVQLK